MIDKIMNQKCLIDKPPVLIDVGASGDIHKIWKSIARYSICIAFDADDRELEVSNDTGKTFKKFYLLNRIVANKSGNMNFYLTKSPYCSSTLDTDLKSLKKYDIKSYFDVSKQIELEAITLTEALKKVGIDYIDWYKTDSQGTDLRIFSILDEDIIENILVAEFEPGIMDAYIGEDKLYKIMEYFDNKSFWCDECNIKGLRRIDEKFKFKTFNTLENRFFSAMHKSNAFWAEISYMNEFESDNFKKRDYLLMAVFAIIKEQYGFAIEISNKAYKIFNDTIFIEIVNYSIKKIKWNGYRRLPLYITRKIFKKLLHR